MDPERSRRVIDIEIIRFPFSRECQNKNYETLGQRL
jgi:hypothetical protein